MKKLAVILALLFAVPGCQGADEEEAKRELTRQQLSIIRTELQGIERGRLNLAQHLAGLQSAVHELDSRIDRADARLLAARRSNSYLAELSTVGFGPSAGRWVLENPAWPTNVLLLFALVVLLCWVLYRVRLANGEAEAMAEVDRVLTRLNPPDAAPAPATTPGPVPPAPAGPEPKLAFPAPAAESKPRAPARAAARPEKVPSREEPPQSAAEEKTDKASPAFATPARKAGSKREARRKPARPPAKKCKVEGCPNKHRSKGYCNKHYQQWRRNETPEGEKED